MFYTSICERLPVDYLICILLLFDLMLWNFILAPIELVLTILWPWVVLQPLRLEIKVLFNFFLALLSRASAIFHMQMLQICIYTRSSLCHDKSWNVQYTPPEF